MGAGALMGGMDSQERAQEAGYLYDHRLCDQDELSDGYDTAQPRAHSTQPPPMQL